MAALAASDYVMGFATGNCDPEVLTTAAGGTIDIEKQYDTITHWTNAASDHGAAWAEFNIR